VTSRLGVILLVIIVVVLIAVRAVPSWASAMTLGTDEGNAFGWNHLPPNEHVDLGFDFWNRDRWPVVVRSVSLPARAHLRIGGTGIMYGTCPFFGEKSIQVRRLVVSVDGYHLAARQHICVLVFASPQTRGKFHVGPVTLHAELPLPVGAIPLEATSRFRTTLCVSQAC
jgi:hypothetical protein